MRCTDPRGGPLGAFCHVLHLAWPAAIPAPDEVLDAHRRLTPERLAYASDIARHHRLLALAREGATVVDAVNELWPDIVALPI
jgi:hypothetical protein